MIEDLEKYNNDIPGLNKLDYARYENIFKVAKDDKFFFFNILKKVVFPDNIDDRYINKVIVDVVAPWTTISYKYYGTQDLWWLICLTNKITNPVAVPTPGTKLKILKTDAVNSVLTSINNQLNN